MAAYLEGVRGLDGGDLVVGVPELRGCGYLHLDGLQRQRCLCGSHHVVVQVSGVRDVAALLFLVLWSGLPAASRGVVHALVRAPDGHSGLGRRLVLPPGRTRNLYLLYLTMTLRTGHS